MKNENNQKCDPCEQKFEKNVDKMVNDVEGYTSSDHKAREKEVDGAFGSKAQGQGQGRELRFHGDSLLLCPYCFRRPGRLRTL